jgi:hypothetical protein
VLTSKLCGTQINYQFCATTQVKMLTLCAGKCSDVSGEIAATLAHAAIAFKSNKELSDGYWSKAKMAYAQTGAATQEFGSSHDVFDLLKVYYPSTGVRSHVFFAAASMYAACLALECPDAETYKEHALALGAMKEGDGGQKWFWEVPGWDNAWWDGALIMAQQGEEGPEIFGKPAFKHYLAELARKWTFGKAPIKCASQQSSIQPSQTCRHCQAILLLAPSWLKASSRAICAFNNHAPMQAVPTRATVHNRMGLQSICRWRSGSCSDVGKSARGDAGHC